ncbi:hypothetical protein [Haloplanus salinus]|jgi:hypothetical protein|uniref:hypothetical protein n=1 Tax=Haloplanus salinus TaxID=1126245 RepID=UPI0011C068B4|nr:hypothetical protein [Haloplanus salinus]
MNAKEEFEEYAQEITRGDSSWEWDVNIEDVVVTVPNISESTYKSCLITWNRDDVSIKARIYDWEPESHGDWFTLISVKQGDDKISGEFRSKEDSIKELKIALSDPETLLGPIKSSVVDEIYRRSDEKLGIQLDNVGWWGKVRSVDLQNGTVSAYISRFQDNWLIEVYENEPVNRYYEEAKILNRTDIYFDDNESLFEAVEEFADDPKAFF